MHKSLELAKQVLPLCVRLKGLGVTADAGCPALAWMADELSEVEKKNAETYQMLENLLMVDGLRQGCTTSKHEQVMEQYNYSARDAVESVRQYAEALVKSQETSFEAQYIQERLPKFLEAIKDGSRTDNVLKASAILAGEEFMKSIPSESKGDIEALNNLRAKLYSLGKEQETYLGL